MVGRAMYEDSFADSGSLAICQPQAALPELRGHVWLTATISPKPSKPVYRRENRLRPGPHTDIIRQVHPPDRAGRVNEEFGRPRDVFTSFAALRMQHSVLPNRLSLGIGEKWKFVVPGLAELL